MTATSSHMASSSEPASTSAQQNMPPNKVPPEVTQSHPDKRSKPRRSSEMKTSIALCSQRKVPILPNEILSLIIHYSIDPFDLTVYPPCISTIIPHDRHCRFSPSHPTIRGIPNLDLKLVNHFFYDKVWTAVIHRFSGSLILSTFSGAHEKAMYEGDRLVNRVFPQNSKLELLMPKVTEIYRENELRILSALDLDVWTGLERVVFSPHWRDQGFELCDHGDGDDLKVGHVLAGLRDEEVLLEVGELVRRRLRGSTIGLTNTMAPTLEILRKFRERRVKLLFLCGFQINPRRYELCLVNFWVDVAEVETRRWSMTLRYGEYKTALKGLKIEKRVNCNPECEEDDESEEEKEKKVSEMEENDEEDAEEASDHDVTR